jgi:ribosome biogenesis ATPase
VVNTLLTELDGLSSRKGVYVIAATNRPDMIDAAMVRPGRLDKLLYVDLPSGPERVEILRAAGRSVPYAAQGVEGRGETKQVVEEIVKARCEGYSGADIAALVREAGVLALKRTLGRLDEAEVLAEGGEGSATSGGQEGMEVVVTVEDFEQAVRKVNPSVSVAQRKRYEALRSKFAGLPVRSSKIRQEEDGVEVTKQEANAGQGEMAT